MPVPELAEPASPSGLKSAPRLFENYCVHAHAWDEIFQASGGPHGHCQALADSLGQLPLSEFQQRRQNADLAFINQGITFSVYADRRGDEKIFPFDLIPRPIAGSDWNL